MRKNLQEPLAVIHKNAFTGKIGDTVEKICRIFEENQLTIRETERVFMVLQEKLGSIRVRFNQ